MPAHGCYPPGILSGLSAPLNPVELAAKNGAALDMWCRTDLGVLLHAQLSQNAGSSFVSGPLISGATATVQNAIVQTNDVSGGTLTGQCKFRYGVDGVNWIQSGVLTGVGPIALQGVLTGAFLSFPTATNWVVDGQYTGVVSGWQDQTGNGNDWINSDYTTSPFLETVGSFAGVPSIRSGPAAPDPSLKRFFANSTLPGFFAGNDKAWTMWIDFQIMNVATGGMLWNFGYTLQNAKDFHEQQYGGSSTLLFNRVDDASLLRQRTTAASFVDALQHYQQNLFSGTNMVLTQDGVAVTLSGGNVDLNVANILSDSLTLFARKGATASNFIDARINEIIWMRGLASAGMQADIQAYLALGASRFV